MAGSLRWTNCCRIPLEAIRMPGLKRKKSMGSAKAAWARNSAGSGNPTPAALAPKAKARDASKRPGIDTALARIARAAKKLNGKQHSANRHGQFQRVSGGREFTGLLIDSQR